jgi:hypothetical protein
MTAVFFWDVIIDQIKARASDEDLTPIPEESLRRVMEEAGMKNAPRTFVFDTAKITTWTIEKKAFISSRIGRVFGTAGPTTLASTQDLVAKE